jgi:squalene-hopene/tetraprenyl-beta-curcumene cyclase
VPDPTEARSSLRRPLACTRARTAIALAIMLAGCSGQAAGSWDPSGAARYLDQRAGAWLTWRTASRDRGTVCVSCHTSLPYLLARGDLRQLLHEPAVPDAERKLLDMVKKRAGLWPQVLPWYGDNQKLLSRGTEPVLNALILTHADARQGHLSDLTLKALDDMWAQQRTDGPDAGSWPWIQFNNEPWEAPDSAYYGATLAAVAVGLTPESYRQEAAVQAKLASLRDYLRRAYPRQTPLNHAYLLWASAALPDLVEPSTRAGILDELSARQGADGGWNLASLMPGWKRHNGSSLPEGSDGYATAFMTFVLQESGISPADPRLARSLAWLEGHQSSWNGRWMTESPNRANTWVPREGDHFMDDAATAFAVLALIRAQTANVVAQADAPTAAR